MPLPLRRLRQALPGTAYHVACGALLPPNTRYTPESGPAISSVYFSAVPLRPGPLGW
jgi:hypothetical protein